MQFLYSPLFEQLYNGFKTNFALTAGKCGIKSATGKLNACHSSLSVFDNDQIQPRDQKQSRIQIG